MRITGRDLRRVINEEVRRSIGLREIRVNNDEEPVAQDGEGDESDEYEPYEEDEEDEEANDEREGMYASLVNNLSILMSTMPNLEQRKAKVLSGLEDIYLRGANSKWSKAVLRTLEKAKNTEGMTNAVGKMGILGALGGAAGAILGGATTFGTGAGVGAAGGAAIGMAAEAATQKSEDKVALAVISSLYTGRVAGLLEEESEYYLNTLDFDFDWYWDTPFEDKYQDVKFIETLVRFINSK